MYSVQKAAAILGIAENTTRAWMKRCGVKGMLVETDRRRRYLLYSDILTLVDYKLNREAEHQKAKESRKPVSKPIPVDNTEDTSRIVSAGETFYSLACTASLLGVAVNTLNKWIKKHNIATKLVGTDKKRNYISHNDVIRLANLQKRKVPLAVHPDQPPQPEATPVESDLDKLYTLKEVALCLNATQTTVRAWIKQHNIWKTTIFSDRRRTYIKYKDVLMLADLHCREINPLPGNLAEEVEEIKKKLKKALSDIEDLKHDFKLYIKRAIYIA